MKRVRGEAESSYWNLSRDETCLRYQQGTMDVNKCLVEMKLLLPFIRAHTTSSGYPPNKRIEVLHDPKNCIFFVLTKDFKGCSSHFTCTLLYRKKSIGYMFS